MKKFQLGLTVFVGGAVVMIFEIIGSRILGPFLGNSIIVWTSLIGTILASLSFGYWWGGRLADRKPTLSQLSLVALISAALLFAANIGKEPLLNFLFDRVRDLRAYSLVASLVLFAPPSICLGMITPYAVRLKMKAIESSGRTVGNLYAISTVGSILGTFLAGFWLIPILGTNRIIFALAFLMCMVSILLFLGKLWIPKAGAAVLLLYFIIQQSVAGPTESSLLRFETDSRYNRVIIYDDIEAEGHRVVRHMRLNKQATSAIYLDSEELYYPYTKYFRLAEHFNPGFRKGLMIGGGAYVFPKYYQKQYPTATLEVVEIDEMLIGLANEHFGFTPSPNVKIIHEGGRHFLNRTTQEYDVIYGDAFRSAYSVPFQLTTKECVQRMHDVLTDDGLVILNFLSELTPEGSQFLQAELATYENIFPQVCLFSLGNNLDSEKGLQNIILVALKSSQTASFESTDPVLRELLNRQWELPFNNTMQPLTDDHAPVDYYISRSL